MIPGCAAYAASIVRSSRTISNGVAITYILNSLVLSSFLLGHTVQLHSTESRTVPARLRRDLFLHFLVSFVAIYYIYIPIYFIFPSSHLHLHLSCGHGKPHLHVTEMAGPQHRTGAAKLAGRVVSGLFSCCCFCLDTWWAGSTAGNPERRWYCSFLLKPKHKKPSKRE